MIGLALRTALGLAVLLGVLVATGLAQPPQLPLQLAGFVR